MTKPLVFVKTRVKIDKIGKEVDSWDLLAFSDCPIMHAAWNPVDKLLVCQFDSAKENIIQIPKAATNTGKITFKEGKAEQYYRVTIYDLDAVQFILDTYVANFKGGEWMLQEQLEQVEEESEDLMTVASQDA